MGSAFESIMRGLEDVKAHREGKIELQSHKLSIEPLAEYDNKKVKDIRLSCHLSQKAFAEVLGVSPKTIESWEHGTNRPSGVARRFLSLIERDSNFLTREKILIEE